MNEVNKKTILVVEDDTLTRETLKVFLKEKFNVIDAGDPGECLKSLAETTPKIDLGLIDIEMPAMDGFQLIKMLRKHPSYTNVPFIMVSSHHEKENVERAVLAGACDYIAKPLNKETILNKIDEHLPDNTDQEAPKSEENKNDDENPLSQWELPE